MFNLILGISCISLSAILCFWAWHWFQRALFSYAILGLMLAGLVLRLFTASDSCLHEWDERYHALVAKNMIEDPFQPMLYKDPALPYDYKDWSSNHIWLHKQPVPLWAMSLSMRLFGVNEWGVRLPSILLSTLAIFLIFVVGRFFFNPLVGFISAFFCAIHGLIIELASGRVATDHIDIFFMFFVLWAIFGTVRFIQQKNKLYLLITGLALGLAILSKWLPALIVLPIWCILTYSSKQWKIRELITFFLIILGLAATIVLPWQIYIFRHFPQEAAWEQLFNLKHILEGLDGHAQPFYYHWNILRMVYGELVYLPIIWFLYKTAKRWKNPKRLALSIWFLIPFLFFSIAQTKMQAYTLFAAPAIFIITAIFFQYIYRYRYTFRYKWLPILILIALIGLPIRYSIERIKPFEKKTATVEWVSEIKKLRKYEHHTKVLIFNTPRPIETMFYVNCTAYNYTPTAAILKELKAKGYFIVVL